MSRNVEQRPSPDDRLALYSRLTMAAVVLGVAFRLVLMLLNRQSNDDHVDVILRLLNGATHLDTTSCWECFQPKVFHQLCAAIASITGLATPSEIGMLAQALNALLGIAILWTAIRLVRAVTSDPRLGFCGISWVALNPALLAINVQATNDTLAILVGSVLLLALHQTIQGRRRALLILGCIGLAPHIKGHGLVLSVVGTTALVLESLLRGPRARWGRAAGAVAGAVLAVGLGFALNTSYLDNYHATGQAFGTNIPRPEPPKWSEETAVERPGIRSITSGLLTFRLGSLLRTPYIVNGPEARPEHRTSLWSTVYGGAYFLHFSQWPPSWQWRSSALEWVGRLLLVLGLVPTGCVIAGGVLAFKRLRPRGSALFDLTHLGAAGAMLAFIALYAYLYRDYAVMKAIFILPALLSFVYLYLVGASAVRNEGARRLLVAAHLSLLVFWTVDLLVLVAQTARHLDSPGVGPS